MRKDSLSNMSNRILLTGADGFTGRHFTKLAEQKGDIVVSLKSDLTDFQNLHAELENIQFEYVVHLAAISAVTHPNQQELYEVNLFGTLNLLSALSANTSFQPKNILIASSANVYGNCVNSPIEETTCPNPLNHYAMSKLAMEKMSAAQFAHMPILVARPFNYTGLGHDDRFVVPKIVDHFVKRSPIIELGNMEIEREFNDVRTVCQIYLALLEFGVPGEVYNICSGRTYSLGTVLASLTEITGHNIKPYVNPDFVRANEIHSLSGSPKKLEACIGPIQHTSLENTLEWMLNRST